MAILQSVGLGHCCSLKNPSSCRRTAPFTLNTKRAFQRTRPIRASALEEQPSSRDGFLDRLGHAWEVLFPPPSNHSPEQHSSKSNAEIAKQRLKMILISDRCSINDDARKKIVGNIVGALADFVEIESEEKVQLNVLVDPDLGTVYSVTVPVRRVKPEYQDFSNELDGIALTDVPDLRTVKVEQHAIPEVENEDAVQVAKQFKLPVDSEHKAKVYHTGTVVGGKVRDFLMSQGGPGSLP